MLKTIILSLLILFGIDAFSQNTVDVRITKITTTNIEVTLYPHQQQYSILSNVVFTLTWKSTRTLSMGTPTSNNLISVVKSGPVLTNGGMKYQVFSGVGFTANNIQNEIKITIPKLGTSRITIANDAFVENNSVNGEYYVSIGGVDVTGDILTTRSMDILEDETFDTQTIKLYYSRDLDLILIKKDGIFITTLGQRISNVNENELMFLGEK